MSLPVHLERDFNEVRFFQDRRWHGQMPGVTLYQSQHECCQRTLFPYLSVLFRYFFTAKRILHPFLHVFSHLLFHFFPHFFMWKIDMIQEQNSDRCIIYSNCFLLLLLLLSSSSSLKGNVSICYIFRFVRFKFWLEMKMENEMELSANGAMGIFKWH